MNKQIKPTAIVLGGTVPHGELVRQLQERGYYVILVDYLPNSPAKAVADEHIQESTMDKEKVLEIARVRNVSLVVCGCVDQANITASYVMEQLGLTPPYSYDTALRITNKGSMKKMMLKKGIPTSRYYYVKSLSEADNIDLQYPVIVKPADANSSNGVKKVKDNEELMSSLEAALQISRNHQAIIEEFVDGQEISAYCIVSNQRAKLLMTAERLSVLDGPDEVIKCYSSIAPARISAAAEQRAEEITAMIAEAYGLDNTPLFFQGIVCGDKVSVIEFAPRTGGGSSFNTIKQNTGFDIISATLDSWMGKPISLDSWSYPSQYYVVNTVYGKNGIYDKITGGDDLIGQGIIEEIFPIRSLGDKIDNSRASTSRVCFFIVKAARIEDVLSRVKLAFEHLDVLSAEGDSLIRRELSLSALWGKDTLQRFKNG